MIYSYPVLSDLPGFSPQANVDIAYDRPGDRGDCALVFYECAAELAAQFSELVRQVIIKGRSLARH